VSLLLMEFPSFFGVEEGGPLQYFSLPVWLIGEKWWAGLSPPLIPFSWARGEKRMNLVSVPLHSPSATVKKTFFSPPPFLPLAGGGKVEGPKSLSPISSRLPPLGNGNGKLWLFNAGKEVVVLRAPPPFATPGE